MANKAVVGQEQRNLPAVLTEIEVDNYARQLAVEVEEFTSAEQGFKSWIEGMKETKKSMEGAISLLNSKMHETSDKVNTRKEYKLVACDIVHDYDEKRVEAIRIDTGEVADSRPMKREELDAMMQLDLDNLADIQENLNGSKSRFENLHD